jgi:hypothetical protein
MKTVNRAVVLFFMFCLFIFLTSFVPGRANSSQDDDQCVRDCAAKNARYRYYVEELRKGSCQACAHCAAAALYQCVLDNCKLTPEQRKEYSEKRDTELASAKELGTECQIK